MRGPLQPSNARCNATSSQREVNHAEHVENTGGRATQLWATSSSRRRFAVVDDGELPKRDRWIRGWDVFSIFSPQNHKMETKKHAAEVGGKKRRDEGRMSQRVGKTGLSHSGTLLALRQSLSLRLLSLISLDSAYLLLAFSSQAVQVFYVARIMVYDRPSSIIFRLQRERRFSLQEQFPCNTTQ